MLPLGIQEILNMDTVSSKVIILAPFNTEDELKIDGETIPSASSRLAGVAGAH
jgi:hypothetical protein